MEQVENASEVDDEKKSEKAGKTAATQACLFL